MHKCHICQRKSADVCRVDDYLVCEECLMQGRLDEIPDFTVVERDETELVSAGATISSWWNREIPEKPAR